MSLLKAAKLSRAPGIGLGVVGVLWGGYAAAWPDIKAGVGASDAQLGFALLFSAAGGVLAMVVAPQVRRKLGRFCLLVPCLAASGAILIPLAAENVATLCACLFLVGILVAGLDILTNVEISAREALHGTHLMGFGHAMFSFAFAASAYGTAVARQAGLGPEDIFPVLCALCVILALFSRTSTSPAPLSDRKSAGAQLPWAAIALTGIILFAAFIGENATEAWSALHIERTLGAPAGEGGLGPAMLGLVMGFGRLIGQTAAERLGPARLIFASALLGMAGALIIAAAGGPDIALLGVAVTALGMAAIVPTAMSILGTRVNDAQRALALSRAWMLGITGFFIGPAVMGGVSELFGLRLSFVAVAGIIALILPAVWQLSRKS